MGTDSAAPGRSGVAEPPDRPGSPEALPELYEPRRSLDTEPLVSISMPVFNSVEFIDDAIGSALAQTYERLEIVVVDDASTDGTYERLLARRDPRLRVLRNAKQLGHARNRNHVLNLTSGSLIKFLDGDDLLEPTCVAEMVKPFLSGHQMGLAFSRRRLLLPDSPSDRVRAWAARYATVHQRFSSISGVNDGRRMLHEWLAAGEGENWIGEPSTVMARREHLERFGGFGFHARQLIDWELWARIIARAQVGFVDQELVGYRTGHESVTSRNREGNLAWLDLLWIYETLASDPELRLGYPRLGPLLQRERRQAWRTVARGGRSAYLGRVSLRSYSSYLGFRSRRALGHTPALHGIIEPL